jgi:hypothetical protein
VSYLRRNFRCKRTLAFHEAGRRTKNHRHVEHLDAGRAVSLQGKLGTAQGPLRASRTRSLFRDWHTASLSGSANA